MGEPKNCEICGRVCQPNKFINVCPGCFEKDQKDFDRVRQYIYDHPGAKIFEVVLSLDIPIEKIKRYLKEERLEIIEKTNRFLTCEGCGQPVRSGTHCEECQKKAAHNFKVVYTPQTGSGQRVHYRSSPPAHDSTLKKVATK